MLLRLQGKNCFLKKKLLLRFSYSSKEPVYVNEDFSTGTLCPVSEDVIAIHNRTHVKFVFLRTRKSRLLVPAENQGVGVIGGRDDLSILAWSDIGPPSPKVHVYRYARPLDIISLEGKFYFKLAIFFGKFHTIREPLKPT